MRSEQTTETIRLMTGIADQGGLHLTELLSDFEQLRDLLSFAVDRFCRDFLHVAELATVPSSEGPSGSPAAPSEDGPTRQVAAGADDARRQLERIAMAVADMTVDLQFHDMANQILARSSGRVTGLAALLTELRQRAQSMPAESSQDGLVKAFAETNAAILEQSQELAVRMRKAVQQKNLDVGDVELF